MAKLCQHDSYPTYRELIGPLREMARRLGYALAVHGTLRRDIDLIACPWADDAVSARALAYSLRAVAEAVCGRAYINPREDQQWQQAGSPGYKDHGRLCWAFHLTDQPNRGPYLDLSVMPRKPESRWLCPACRCLNSETECWSCGKAA